MRRQHRLVRAARSSRDLLGILGTLLIVTGCSTRGVIHGKVIVPPPSDPDVVRAPEGAPGTSAARGSASSSVVFVVTEETDKSKRQSDRAGVEQSSEGFTPHVLPVVLGSEVDFRNGDRIYHNAFSVSPAKKFDVGRYAPGETRSVIFDRPGIVSIFCELHPSSACFVVVLPDHLFTQPDASGKFTLPKLPQGTYTVKAWHPIYGETSRQVDLPKSGDVDVELEF
jgi:plastocyanin